MLTSILAILAIYGAVLILSLVIVMTIDRFRDRSSMEQMVAESNRSALRLRTPQFAEVSSIFKCELPSSILRLYASNEELARQDFEIVRGSGRDPLFISYYLPCDPETVSDCYDDCKELLAFATDGSDLIYAVNPRLESPPVLAYDVDAGTFETVARTLDGFLAWPRRSVLYQDS